MRTTTVQMYATLTSPLQRLLPWLLAPGFICGCQPQVNSRDFTVEIQVESDVGVPLGGARVLRDNHEQGRTAADGKLRVTLVGHEGETASLRVACPDDYASPDSALPVPLRSLAGSNTVPRYKALCPPLLRNLVVAVRTQQGAGLPVTYRGREVGRTDPAGAAHVLLRVPPKDKVALMLDTSADPSLRPKNPELSLEMPAQDKIVLFDKTFTHEKPAPSKKRGSGKRPGPTPIRMPSR